VTECTWRGCTDEGVCSQKDSDGNEWANLCKWHRSMLNASIKAKGVKHILRAWVLASGGAEKLAKKTTDGLFKGR